MPSAPAPLIIASAQRGLFLLKDFDEAGMAVLRESQANHNRLVFRLLAPFLVLIAAASVVIVLPYSAVLPLFAWILATLVALAVVSLGFGLYFWLEMPAERPHLVHHYLYCLALTMIAVSFNLRNVLSDGDMSSFVASLFMLNLLASGPYWLYPALGLSTIGSWIAGTLLIAPPMLTLPRLSLSIIFSLMTMCIGLFLERQRREATVNRHLLDAANRELRELSITDPLTGAYNRRFFEETLGHLMLSCRRSKRPLSLLFLDLDHFKLVNDNFGHDTGDQVLRETVACVRECLRKSDIVARWGGEEFVVVLPDTPLDDAGIVAERIRAKRAGTVVDGHNFTVTLSIGLTAIRPGDSQAEVVKRADQALYQAKSSGRNQWISIQGEQPAHGEVPPA